MASEQAVIDQAYQGLERVEALERLWCTAREQVAPRATRRQDIYAARTRVLVAAIDARLADDRDALKTHAGRALAFNPFDALATALLTEDIAVRTLHALRNALAPVIAPVLP